MCCREIWVASVIVSPTQFWAWRAICSESATGVQLSERRKVLCVVGAQFRASLKPREQTLCRCMVLRGLRGVEFCKVWIKVLLGRVRCSPKSKLGNMGANFSSFWQSYRNRNGRNNEMFGMKCWGKPSEIAGNTRQFCPRFRLVNNQKEMIRTIIFSSNWKETEI